MPHFPQDLPNLGWTLHSPVERCTALERRCRCAWFGFKRDDLLEPLYGGTKVRKLNLLLAQARFQEASAWASAGAIGSGHLVATALAAQAQGKRFEAYTFYQIPTNHVRDNLALVVRSGARLRYFEDRVHLALKAPGVLLSPRIGDTEVIPPGASSRAGALGLVMAVEELAAQVRDGSLPAPEVIVVPFGSGGTAAGLAVGLGLAELDCVVVAVAVVEAPLSSKARLLELTQMTALELKPHVGPITPAPIRVIRSALGFGYGRPTRRGQDAIKVALSQGVHLESTYSGKALSAVLRRPRWARGKRVLFWVTPRRQAGPVVGVTPSALPPRLRGRLGLTV